MGAPPSQYPIGQNQNAGAYAAQGWGAAAYQQWPGQPNDPCTFTFVGGLVTFSLLTVAIVPYFCSEI